MLECVSGQVKHWCLLSGTQQKTEKFRDYCEVLAQLPEPLLRFSALSVVKRYITIGMPEVIDFVSVRVC
jgi:hypothetical protein